MTRSYSGPLFQVVVGDQNTSISSAAKHDATQIPGHGVNIADLRSFCGSPLSNCIVSKIYAQIRGSANDIVTSAFRCSNSNCAAQLALDGSGTGMPRIPVGIPLARLSGLGVSQYTIAGDATATGITGGRSSSSSVFEVGFSYPATVCCGSFGISHAWDAANTPGTDLLVGIQFGTATIYVVCPASNDYCLFPDLESNNRPVPISLGTTALFTANLMTWNSSTNRLSGYSNGAAQWTPQNSGFFHESGQSCSSWRWRRSDLACFDLLLRGADR